MNFLGFSKIPPYKPVEVSHPIISFKNTITENDSTNAALYDYSYNGWSVVVGDVNSDVSNGVGYLQKEDGSGTFFSAKLSGFYVSTNARTIAKIELGRVSANNDGEVSLFQFR